jgi:hypothetical protein
VAGILHSVQLESMMEYREFVHQMGRSKNTRKEPFPRLTVSLTNWVNKGRVARAPVTKHGRAHQ